MKSRPPLKLRYLLQQYAMVVGYFAVLGAGMALALPWLARQEAVREGGAYVAAVVFLLAVVIVIVSWLRSSRKPARPAVPAHWLADEEAMRQRPLLDRTADRLVRVICTLLLVAAIGAILPAALYFGDATAAYYARRDVDKLLAAIAPLQAGIAEALGREGERVASAGWMDAAARARLGVDRGYVSPDGAVVLRTGARRELIVLMPSRVEGVVRWTCLGSPPNHLPETSRHAP